MTKYINIFFPITFSKTSYEESFIEGNFSMASRQPSVNGLQTMLGRCIALIDMDCFYVQVEERLQPHNKGKPGGVLQYNGMRQWTTNNVQRA